MVELGPDLSGTFINTSTGFSCCGICLVFNKHFYNCLTQALMTDDVIHLDLQHKCSLVDPTYEIAHIHLHFYASSEFVPKYRMFTSWNF